jgi:hypothetical protein
MEITRINKIDLSGLTYSEQRPFGEHAKIVYVNDAKGKPIVLQTPVMTTPFGLGRFEDASGRVKYSIDMSFRGKDGDTKIAQLHDFLELLDDKIVTDATQRGKSWFRKNKNPSKEFAKELFAPSIKQAMEKGVPTDKYPSTFKTKLPFYDGKFATPVFDMVTKKLLDVPITDALSKGSLVQCIVKLNGIWFAAKNFGVSWEVKQMKVKEGDKISDYGFDDSDDEDETCRYEDDKKDDKNTYEDDKKDDKNTETLNSVENVEGEGNEEKVEDEEEGILTLDSDVEEDL